jgi:hypothetical protein
MNDQAQHHFALAFSPIHGYPAKYTVQQVLELLDMEMNLMECNSTLISSELSPFYFNNPRFLKWIERFDNIVVIVTLRRQSDLLLSLFNQLIKDPQIRYSGKFFQLVMNNLGRMNFYQGINRWAEKVGDKNIRVVNYEDGVVQNFLNIFELSLSFDGENSLINPSLPSSSLMLMQERGKLAVDSNQYAKIRDEVLYDVKKYTENILPERILLTKGELQSLDKYFENSNNLLAKKYLEKDVLFKTKKYEDVLCF